MAVPMISLTIVTLLVPIVLLRLNLLPSWRYVNLPAAIALVISGLSGCLLGGSITLSRVWSRPIQAQMKFLQDLLAYDFYVDRLYRVSVVFAVDSLSRLSAWFDRYVVDGVVNLAGLTTVFSAESLKYSAPGQTQLYALVIFLSITFLGVLMNWSLVSELLSTMTSSLH
jgi:NAD(P)H-quinone oxidoreductase subunit 5